MKTAESKSEAKIQSECVQWLRNTYPETSGLFFEINNNPLNAVDGARRLAAGMIKGVADTCFIWNGLAYFFEFKDAKGKQSKAQKIWEQKVTEHGLPYFIVRSLEEFQFEIEIILKDTEL